MIAKDYRKLAWGKLSGKWGVFALIFFIYYIILGALEGTGGVDVQNQANTVIIGLLSIVSFILMGPFEYGLKGASLKVSNAEVIKVENLFDGFKDFSRAFLLNVINSIFVFLWSLLFIIPGIIKVISYSMSYYIIIENPNMSANDARKESMRIMQGNKWRYFCLQLSFIGWLLLSILTFGILLYWVNPYMYVANAEFYKSLKETEQTITTKE